MLRLVKDRDLKPKCLTNKKHYPVLEKRELVMEFNRKSDLIMIFASIELSFRINLEGI
jgi:hypothetical protein